MASFSLSTQQMRATVLPFIVVLLFVVFLLYIALKFYILPAVIKHLIWVAPIKPATLVQIDLREITDSGVHIACQGTVKDTRLPISFVSVQVTIPCIRIYDAILGDILCDLHLDKPVLVNGLSDMDISQFVRVELSNNVEALRGIVDRLLIGGPTELARIVVRLEFSGTFLLMNWLLLEDISCFKSINIADFVKANFPTFCSMAEKTSNSDSFSSDPVDSSGMNSISDSIFVPSAPETKELIPDATLKPLPVVPRLRTIVGGIEIVFEKPPGLNLVLGDIKFEAILNGSRVAYCTMQGVSFSNVHCVSKIMLEVEPCVTSSNPLSGLAAAARGIVTGAVKGTLNGLFYGDWGAGSTILGLQSISVMDQNGNEFDWLRQLLGSLQLEHDIDAVKKGAEITQKATGKFKDGFLRMATDLMATAGRQSKCTVM